MTQRKRKKLNKEWSLISTGFCYGREMINQVQIWYLVRFERQILTSTSEITTVNENTTNLNAEK